MYRSLNHKYDYKKFHRTGTSFDHRLPDFFLSDREHYPYYESYTTWHRYGIYENVSRHLSRTSLLGNTLSLAGICMLVFLLICYYPIRNLLEHKIQKPALFKQGLIIVQIFIGSLFFITSIGLFRQLHFILSKDKGIDYERVIQVDLGYDTSFQTDLSVLKPEMTNHPYVEEVTYTCGNVQSLRNKGIGTVPFTRISVSIRMKPNPIVTTR